MNTFSKLLFFIGFGFSLLVSSSGKAQNSVPSNFEFERQQKVAPKVMKKEVAKTSLNGQSLVDQKMIADAPTKRVRDYLKTFPSNYVVTPEWYSENIEKSPLKDFTKVELTHFRKYMMRFYSPNPLN